MKIIQVLSNLITEDARFQVFYNKYVLPSGKRQKGILPFEIVKQIVLNVAESYNSYQDMELERGINTGIDYTIHYDLLEYVEEWCNALDIESCKFLLQKIGREKEIFLGEFVKALLKINNISCEMEKIAEMTGNIEFLSKLKEIPGLTLKYVVTNQSLYV